MGVVGMDVNPECAGAAGSRHTAPTRLRRTPSKSGPDVGSREGYRNSFLLSLSHTVRRQTLARPSVHPMAMYRSEARTHTTLETGQDSPSSPRQRNQHRFRGTRPGLL